MLAVLREARDGGRDSGAGEPASPRARRFAKDHGLVRQNGSGPKLTGAGLMLLASLEREQHGKQEH